VSEAQRSELSSNKFVEKLDFSFLNCYIYMVMGKEMPMILDKDERHG
jgi:hypothetical protein